MGTRTARQALIPGLTLLVGALILPGCFINRNLTKNSEFQSFVGKSFVLTDDVLAFHFDDKPRSTKLAPFGPDGANLPSRAEMRATPFQFKNTFVIEDIVPKGSVFKITRVTNDRSFEMGIVFYTAIITRSSNNFLIGRTVIVNDLTTEFFNKGVPTFNPDLVKPYSQQFD